MAGRVPLAAGPRYSKVGADPVATIEAPLDGPTSADKVAAGPFGFSSDASAVA